MTQHKILRHAHCVVGVCVFALSADILALPAWEALQAPSLSAQVTLSPRMALLALAWSLSALATGWLGLKLEGCL